MRGIIIYLLVGFLTLSVCYAQSSDSLTDKKVISRIAELKKQRVDMSVCYYVECSGGVKLYHPDSCNIGVVKYLFWEINNDAYTQRFDNCNNYEPYKISTTLVSTIRNNLSAIKRAQLKYPEYVEVDNGKKTRYTVMIDHSCHYMFEINTPGGVISKDIDGFAYEKYINDKYFNLNYHENQASVLTKLKSLAKQITDKLYPIKKAPNGAFKYKF